MLRLNSADADFAEKFATFLNNKRQSADNVDNDVKEIITQVQQKGDVALKEYTQKFDGWDAEKLRIDPSDLKKAFDNCPRSYLNPLEMAIRRIEDYHQKTYPEGLAYQDEEGLRLGMRYTPFESVGIYIPGGKAAYPSSVYMSIVPAQIAGVKNITAVVPHMNGECNPFVLTVLHHLNITDVFAVGGAQAIAALAYGTETIPAVDFIAGPGNIYVATAKKQLYGTVGIDLIAGPSEILVVSDAETDPNWTALDLLAQAEHDTMAQSILISCDDQHIADVCKAMDEILPTLKRRDIIEQSLRDYGAIIKVNDLAEAVTLTDKIAPEHLQISLVDSYDFAHKIQHAGAIFLGKNSCGALSDYTAGPSHVLPTNRSARFSSILSAQTFLKQTSILECSNEGLIHLAEITAQLAEMEGLDAHQKSIETRLQDLM